MASKSPASILKAKGLIPKEWDLRSLSRGQKSWITKLTQPARENKPPGKFRQVILKPQEFSTVKAQTKRHKAQAKAAGLPVANGKALVHTQGGKVRRRGDKLVIETPNRKLDLWFANSKTFTKAVEKARKRKLKKNQVWAFGIGNNVSNENWRDLDMMLDYLRNKNDWHSPDATDYISLVLISENRSQVVAHNGENEDEED